MIFEKAPAKINLALHVTGRRDDGYHLLDSIVAFAETGDEIGVEEADSSSLEISGPFAEGLATDGNNLVIKALALMAGRFDRQDSAVAIKLEKNLPLASGIGGGSADAAATMRALIRLWELGKGDDVQALLKASLALGADVPVCLHSLASHMSGIGETLKPVLGMPSFATVLVNPGVEISTAEIFNSLDIKPGARAFPSLRPHPANPALAAWVQWLGGARNDLQAPAVALVPEINHVLNRLAEQKGCMMSRMSGSGATCFGIYDAMGSAEQAAMAISQANPDWWCEVTLLNAKSI